MCHFFSALYMRNGDLLARPDLTDSHADLLEIFGIKEDGEFTQHYAKLELTPPENGDGIEDVANWKFTVDERKAPDWMDVERAERLMRERAARMIVTDKRKVAWDGAWVLCGSGGFETVKGVARIVRMYGTSQVGEMYDTSQVVAMCDASQVVAMCDASKVGAMYDTSKVVAMYDTSKVGKMYDTSQVGAMYNTSHVVLMCDTSQVGVMCDTSQVVKMYGTSKVVKMYGTSKVGEMYNTSKVGEMGPTAPRKPAPGGKEGENA
jgi:hypothetical protein